MSPVGPPTALDEKRRSLTNWNLDQRQREALPFICEWVEAVALLPQAWRDTAWAMSEENVELARRTFEAFNRTYTEGTDDL